MRFDLSSKSADELSRAAVTAVTPLPEMDQLVACGSAAPTRRDLREGLKGVQSRALRRQALEPSLSRPGPALRLHLEAQTLHSRLTRSSPCPQTCSAPAAVASSLFCFGVSAFEPLWTFFTS